MEKEFEKKRIEAMKELARAEKILAYAQIFDALSRIEWFRNLMNEMVKETAKQNPPKSPPKPQSP